MMKTFAIFMLSLFLTSISYAGEVPQNTDKMPCDDKNKMEDVLNEKGYFHLLDMKDENGVPEQLWSGGPEIIITVQKDEKICLLSKASNVVFNPITLEKIVNVWKSTQKKL